MEKRSKVTTIAGMIISLISICIIIVVLFNSEMAFKDYVTLGKDTVPTISFITGNKTIDRRTFKNTEGRFRSDDVDGEVAKYIKILTSEHGFTLISDRYKVAKLAKDSENSTEDDKFVVIVKVSRSYTDGEVRVEKKDADGERSIEYVRVYPGYTVEIIKERGSVETLLNSDRKIFESPYSDELKKRD